MPRRSTTTLRSTAAAYRATWLIANNRNSGLLQHARVARRLRDGDRRATAREWDAHHRPAPPVLEALQRARHHVTAEDIATRIRARHPQIDPSTVYRNLEALEALGYVTHTHFDDRVTPGTAPTPSATATSSAGAVGPSRSFPSACSSLSRAGYGTNTVSAPTWRTRRSSYLQGLLERILCLDAPPRDLCLRARRHRATLAGSGLVVAPHVDPPGTPKYHDHVLARTACRSFLANMQARSTRAGRAHEHLVDVATYSFVLALLVFAWPRLPRPALRSGRRALARAHRRRAVATCACPWTAARLTLPRPSGLGTPGTKDLGGSHDAAHLARDGDARRRFELRDLRRHRVGTRAPDGGALPIRRGLA